MSYGNEFGTKLGVCFLLCLLGVLILESPLETGNWVGR